MTTSPSKRSLSNERSEENLFEPKLRRLVGRVIDLEQELAEQIAELSLNETSYKKQYGAVSNQITAFNNWLNANNSSTTTSPEQQPQSQSQQQNNVATTPTPPSQQQVPAPPQQQQQQYNVRARRRSSTSFVGLPPIGEPDKNNNNNSPSVSPLLVGSGSSLNNTQNSMTGIAEQVAAFNNTNTNDTPNSGNHPSPSSGGVAIVALPSALQEATPGSPYFSSGLKPPRPISASSAKNSNTNNNNNNSNATNQQTGKDDSSGSRSASSSPTKNTSPVQQNQISTTLTPPPAQKSVTFFGTSVETDSMKISAFVKTRRNATNTTIRLIRTLTKAIILDFVCQAQGELTSLPMNLDPLEMRSRLRILSSHEFRVNKLRFIPLSDHEKEGKLKFDFEDEVWRDQVLLGKKKNLLDDDNYENDNVNNDDDVGFEPFVAFSISTPNRGGSGRGNKTLRSKNEIQTTQVFDSFEQEERAKADRKIKEIDVLARLALTNMKNAEWYNPKYEVSIQKRTENSLGGRKQDFMDEENAVEKEILFANDNVDNNNNNQKEGDRKVKVPIPPKTKYEGIGESSLRFKREERELLRRSRELFLGRDGDKSSSMLLLMKSLMVMRLIGKNLASGGKAGIRNNNINSSGELSFRLPPNPSIDAVWAQVFVHKQNRDHASGGFGTSRREADENYHNANNDRSDNRRARSPTHSLFSSSISSSASNWSGERIPRLCRCDESERENFEQLQDKRRKVQEMRSAERSANSSRRSFLIAGYNNNNNNNSQQENCEKSNLISAAADERLYGVRGKFPTFAEKLAAQERREAKKGKYMGSSFRKISPTKDRSKKSSTGQDDDIFGERRVDNKNNKDKIPILKDKMTEMEKKAEERKKRIEARSLNLPKSSSDYDEDGKGKKKNSPGKLLRVSPSAASTTTTTTTTKSKQTPKKPVTLRTTNTSRPPVAGNINKNNNNRSSGKKTPVVTTAKRTATPNNNSNTKCPGSSPSSSRAQKCGTDGGEKDDKKNNNNNDHSKSSAAAILAAASQKYRHVRYRRKHHDAVTILTFWWRSLLECRKAKRFCQKLREKQNKLAQTFQRFGRGFLLGRRKLFLMKRGITSIQRSCFAKISELVTSRNHHQVQVVNSFEGWKQIVTLAARRFLARREVKKRKTLLDEYTDHRLDLERNDDEVIVITLQWRYDTLLKKLCDAWGVSDSSWKRSAVGALHSALEDRKKRNLAIQQQQDQNEDNNNEQQNRERKRPAGKISLFRKGVTGNLEPGSPFSPFEKQRRQSLVKFSTEIGVGNEELQGRFSAAGSRRSSNIINTNNYDSLLGLAKETNTAAMSGEFDRSTTSPHNNTDSRRDFMASGALSDAKILGLDQSVSKNLSSNVMDMEGSDLSPSMRLAAVDAVKRARFGAIQLNKKKIRCATKIQKIFRAFWSRKYIVAPLREVMSAMEDFKKVGQLHVEINDKLLIREDKKHKRHGLYLEQGLKKERQRLKTFWSPNIFEGSSQLMNNNNNNNNMDSSQRQNNETENALHQVITSIPSSSPPPAKKARNVRFGNDDDELRDSDLLVEEVEEIKMFATPNSPPPPSLHHQQHSASRSLLYSHRQQQQDSKSKLQPPTSVHQNILAAIDNPSLIRNVTAAKLTKIEHDAQEWATEETKSATPSKIDFLVQNQFRKDVVDVERRQQYHRFLATETRFFQEHTKLPVVSKM